MIWDRKRERERRHFSFIPFMVFKVPVIFPVSGKIYIRKLCSENVLKATSPSLHIKAFTDPKLQTACSSESVFVHNTAMTLCKCQRQRSCKLVFCMTCICSQQMELHRNFYKFLNMLSPTGAQPMVFHPQSLTAPYSPNGTL